MIPLLEHAIESRQVLIESLHGEGTDCYRLFHGTNEGAPGVTVDRYGPQLLIQTFHEPLAEGLSNAISATCCRLLSLDLVTVTDDRSQRNSRPRDDQVVSHSEALTCRELGVDYVVKGKHEGQDPLLFLDMRAGRRWMQANARGKSVLNLFAYTCGVGVVAATAGAAEVLNVDFAQRSLDVGRQNAELNGLTPAQIDFVHSDFFPAVKQLAGMPIKSRGRRGQKSERRKYPILKPRLFDLTFLDPPRWAKSLYGTVDLVRDYQSVLKPSLLATREGGELVCVNNVAKVDLDEWLTLVMRCADKAGRPVRSHRLLAPEADFPSPDGKFPLKMAVLQLA